MKFSKKKKINNEDSTKSLFCLCFCLVILLKTKNSRTFAEASTAHVDPIATDYATPTLAAAASTIKGTFCVFTVVFWDEINWHCKKGSRP